MPVERLYRLPAGVDPLTAVSVLHTAATAHLGLFREAQLRLGQTIVVGGGVGGFGSAVVQLARAAGARVIATAMAGLAAHPSLPVGALYTRDASLRGFAISNASIADLAAAADAINALLASGALRSRISMRLPLSDAAQAHRLQENHDPATPPGRIVVIP